MEKNSGNFSMQEAMRLMNSEAGQKLLAILQSSKDPSLQTAMEQAKKGDMNQAKAALGKITSSPEVQALLRQLGGK
ncbi:MAG: hypothetical protein IKU57_03210 [Oscillospiraceae bacterium]|nr:hypothetical protein [Oscillospiraceae bacterium]